MMRHRRVRLAVLSPELILRQMREEDGRCGRRGECPLQEVDLGALTFPRQWEDELRMASGGLFDLLVD